MTAYVTDAQAETYFDGDPRAEAFLEADYTWYLVRASNMIDAIPIQGHKLESSQARAFPRKYPPTDYESPWGSTVTADAYGYVYLSTSVPQDVLDACCEEALALYRFHADTDRVERRDMQDDGIQSYSLGGDYSESMVSPKRNRQCGLLSTEAYALLQKYIDTRANII